MYCNLRRYHIHRVLFLAEMNQRAALFLTLEQGHQWNAREVTQNITARPKRHLFQLVLPKLNLITSTSKVLDTFVGQTPIVLAKSLAHEYLYLDILDQIDIQFRRALLMNLNVKT
jgi:hypothetical protein